MFAVPSAILVVAMGFLTSPVAASVSSVERTLDATGASSRAMPTSNHRIRQRRSSQIQAVHPYRGMARRKTRLKAVLEESRPRASKRPTSGPSLVPSGCNFATTRSLSCISVRSRRPVGSAVEPSRAPTIRPSVRQLARCPGDSEWRLRWTARWRVRVALSVDVTSSCLRRRHRVRSAS